MVAASRRMFGNTECPGSPDANMKMWITYRCDGGQGSSRLTGVRRCLRPAPTTALKECHIQNMTYLIDTSLSMNGTNKSWKPTALDLVRQMVTREVDVVDYTLMNYVKQVQVMSTTSSSNTFYDDINNLQTWEGGTEYTFAGLRAALERSPCHNFIVVFTDEVGDDTYNQSLKKKIIKLKDKKKSEIFFMVTQRHPKLVKWKLAKMKKVFDGIGHIIDLDNERQNPVKAVVDLMIASDICDGVDCDTNRNLMIDDIGDMDPVFRQTSARGGVQQGRKG